LTVALVQLEQTDIHAARLSGGPATHIDRVILDDDAIHLVVGASEVVHPLPGERSRISAQGDDRHAGSGSIGVEGIGSALSGNAGY
jgi:hypothetical protein